MSSKDFSDAPTRVPSRTPSRTPTRGGRGRGRQGPPRTPLPSGTVLKGGAFRIVDVLGEGGFSITYVGLEGSRKVTVAIKELFPLGCVRKGLDVAPDNHWDPKAFEAARADFINEGKVLKFFTHPGIVQSYSPFEENGTAYLAMEFLQGESLLLALQRRGVMNQVQGMEVALQIGGALHLVHDRTVIHSDIKPENIIYTDDRRFVLLDFGVSRRHHPGRLSKAAVVAVSPPYSPPEQYHSSKALSPASDVYSLAATLYTMLSCRMPPDAVSRQKGEPLPSLLELNPTITPACWKALETAMQLSPESRQQSMAEFLYQLTGKDIGQGYAQPNLSESSPSHMLVEKAAEFEAHRKGIYSLLLHPQQPLLISGGRDGSVGLWKWPTGEPKGSLKAHETPMTGLALSPDGSLLMTAGEPGEVKLWEVAAGKLLRVLRSGPPAVMALAFSPSNHAVFIAMADGTVHHLTPQLVEPHIMHCHSGVVTSIAVSPDATMLATAGQDGFIKIWDAHTFSPIIQLVGHDRPVLHVEFSLDSKLLLSGSSDYTARIWEIAAGLELRRFREEGANIRSGAFTCDPDIVVTANGDKNLHFYRLSTGRSVFSTEADNNYLRRAVADLRYPYVASGGGDGHVRIWHFQP